jgi:predicted phosphodiesterase
LYDIHGNLPALEAVLAELRHERVDQVVVGGDVAPGPMVRQTLDALTSLEVPVHYIHGNGEVAVLAERRSGPFPAWYLNIPEGAKQIVRWQAAHIGANEERAFASWPRTVSLTVAGLGDVLFCHATPRDVNECFTRLTPEEPLRPLFDGLKVVVCGHTHMQFDRRIGGTRVVNAGSVGMPFGRPGADWLLLGPDLQLRHTDYDLEKAAARIRASDYCEAREFAERYVLDPPSEPQMLEAFTHASFTQNH